MHIVLPVQHVQQVKLNTPDDTSVEFRSVVFDIAEILENAMKSTSDIEKFKCLCYGLTTNGQLFFSTAENEAIRTCKSFHELFSATHRSMRSDSHQLLDKIVQKVGLPEASAKLDQFKRKIDYQIKLKAFLTIVKLTTKAHPMVILRSRPSSIKITLKSQWVTTRKLRIFCQHISMSYPQLNVQDITQYNSHGTFLLPPCHCYF